MYKRIIQNQIKAKFFKGKAIIIVGARQTGKTTLALELIGRYGKNAVRIFNCDNPTDRELLSNKDLEFLQKIIGKARIVFIDEGQKADTIGQTLKLLVDFYKDKKQIIVTGSSSFNLLDKTQEPLTGRKFVFNLFPLSVEEIYPEKNTLKILKELEPRLIYGSYPEVAAKESFTEKEEALREISASYLYKDILESSQIKNSSALIGLLKALALQVGSEASYTELANVIGSDKKTVERYIDILEKNYIVFKLPPYAKNKRKIISKLKKIYFWDTGVRNAVINNFNFLSSRDDAGALWENFIIAERLKYQAYHKLYRDNYFWRTYDRAEIDLVEEKEGKPAGYEFKWKSGKKKTGAPAQWQDYSGSSYKVITPNDLDGFVL